MAKNKQSEQFWDIAMALAFTFGPFGFGVPIKFACVSWSVAWLAFLHLLWNLQLFVRLGTALKLAWAILLTVTLCYISYPAIRSAYIREKAKATSGDLVAESDGQDHASDPPVLQLGDGATKFTWKGKSGEPMMSQNMPDYRNMLSLEMVNGRVQLSTTLRTKDGSLIVEIVNNHWTVASATSISWDKNYTDDRLEVKDGKGRVVLQVRLLPNIVQFQAEWGEDKGESFPIIESGRYSVQDGITPVFKYPSELYWGEMKQ